MWLSNNGKPGTLSGLPIPAALQRSIGLTKLQQQRTQPGLVLTNDKGVSMYPPTSLAKYTLVM